MGRSRLIDQALRDLVELRLAARVASGRARRRILSVERRQREALGPSVPKTRAARALGVSVTTLDRWIDRGALPVVRRPGSGRAEVATEPLVELAVETEAARAAGADRAPVAAGLRRLEERRSGQDDRARAPMGLPGYFPDHELERRADYAASRPAERVAEAIRLSRTATELTARRR